MQHLYVVTCKLLDRRFKLQNVFEHLTMIAKFTHNYNNPTHGKQPLTGSVEKETTVLPYDIQQRYQLEP